MTTLSQKKDPAIAGPFRVVYFAQHPAGIQRGVLAPRIKERIHHTSRRTRRGPGSQVNEYAK